MTEEKIWTLLDLIRWTTDYFREKEIENPRLNVETLLGKALNMRRVDLYVNYDKIVTPEERDEFKRLIRRRLNGEPLQYIIGETGFFGLTIKLTPDVLIPRPETELLVETALEAMDPETKSLADLGTGSGCIALALAVNRPDLKIIATDISDSALRLARENAEILGLNGNISFIKQDMTRNILPPQEKVDVIVANPPYISLAEYSRLETQVKNFEPENALTDGADGLTFYRIILEKARDHFSSGRGMLFMELGYNQWSEVNRLAEELGYREIEIKKDYANINRILKANYG